MPMTDEELAHYCCIPIESVSKIDARTRRVIDRMADFETEWSLYKEGLGPKPEGALIDIDRSPKRGR